MFRIGRRGLGRRENFLSETDYQNNRENREKKGAAKPSDHNISKQLELIGVRTTDSNIRDSFL